MGEQKERRKYTREFKLEAVRLYKSSGKSMRAIESEVGSMPYLLAKGLGLAAIMPFLIASCIVPNSSTCTITPTALIQSTTSSSSTLSVDVQWLKANAIPFETAEPNSSLEDLMPLKDMIGNARIVALGEATHGTHEFFQMKHRMLEFLVEEMGFNTFAMEANWPEANLINDYVHGGTGDPAELLKGLYFWTWDTQEVLDMIRWMRAYNEDPSHTRKLSLYGFDMQFGQMARDNVAQYMQKVDPQAAQQVAEDYSCYPGNSVACQTKLQAVYDWLEQHQADYIAKSSAKEFSLALHSARVVIQYQDYTAQNNNVPLRDRYMAENVTWIVDQAGPDAKIVLWAHNGHVGMSGEETSRRMGDYLRKQYDNQMVVFGFLFYQGAFNAYGNTSLQTFHVGAPPVDSYETFFHEAGLPRFFLDLRSVRPGGAASDWLLAPHPFRMIGSAYFPHEPQFFFKTVALARIFDVVVYFQDTSPSLLLEK
jgi:erythromycin esterase